MKSLSAILPLAPAFLLGACLARPAAAQLIPVPPDQLPGAQPPSATTPPPDAHPAIAPISIATVPIQGVSLSGSLSVADGRATIGNNGTITAGDKTAHVDLTRGGSLSVCASTKIHLSTDNTTPGGALMIAIDRGAIEAHYTPGQYSDVVLTPDLRILISPPGQADFSLRINNQGDTCIDNHGDRAPYILVSNMFEGGAYRVQPNQRVLFEHGSLRQVVDNEAEPCGCPPETPPPPAIVSVGKPGATPRTSQKANTAAAQNPFPLAESEGLKPPPPASTTPIVPTGQTHAQVEAPLAYNGRNPAPLPSTPPETATTAAAPAAPAPASPPPPAKPHRGFFGHIGHFFAHIF